MRGLPPEHPQTSPSFSPAFLAFNLIISLENVQLLKTKRSRNIYWERVKKKTPLDAEERAVVVPQ
jgi:hypothetical protein